jgi:ABC-type transport system involved in multi-copper enzyme maturation permease subunit
MTFLPIVDRELREGSRRRGTYWLRVRVAFQALLVGLVAYVMNFLEPQVKLGGVLFWGLSGVSMLFCLLAGRRSTADCISQEKRDGTLGLLFLTDLKGYDVVLGKMVATSISGFYALVAIFPVLAIPLLVGGMTNGEFWRMLLVLVNTFFLSLSIGIFASAISREYRTAMAVNFLLGLLLVGAPAACAMWWLATRNKFLPQLMYSCPFFSFTYCDDARYSTLARDFWWSLAVTHGLAWMLTLLACWIVPRTWGDKPAPAPSRRWRWRDLGRLLSHGNQARRAAFRKRALDVNAFYWLAARARLKPAHVWLFLGCAVVWWILGRLRSGNYWMAAETFFATGFIVNSALKLWVALEAGQRLGEDRRAGAFELLLATPLTVGDFLRGQIMALRRQFLRPLLLVTALELVLAVLLKQRGTLNTLEFFTCLAGIGMLWADVVTLPWVAMAAALTFKSQTQATSFTVARIFILPWVMYLSVAAGLNLLYQLDLTSWEPGQRFGLWLWSGIGLATDLLFGLRAWHTLRKNFRRLAVQSFLPEPARRSWWRSCWAAVKWTGQLAGRCVPARVRKPVFACLAVCVAVTAVLLVRRGQQHFPPPVLVSITQSNAPFNIFPGGGSGVFFIMPDGTLWQWGKPGAPQAPRAAVPEQIGTAHDWVKVVGAGTHCLGLRADGTIWGWGFSNGRYNLEPQPVIAGNDWIDLGTGTHHAAGIKRDGTLWIWNEPLVVNDGRAQPILAFQVAAEYFKPLQSTRGFSQTNVFSHSNWISVYCGPESTFALQKDGTIWAQGRFSPNNLSSFPTLVCEETNWAALSADGLARNRAGQLWGLRYAIPNPQAGAEAVCALVSSNGPFDRVHSMSENSRVQVRANGTLWSAPLRPGSASAPSAGDWRQLGTRADWVAAWGQGATGFGLTADGTVWTWGVELGQEPVKTYASRLELLRKRLTGFTQPTASGISSLSSAQPRPLLKLVGGTANPQRK